MNCAAAALEPSRNKSKSLDNVAVTLTEQQFDRASESSAEIFPVALIQTLRLGEHRREKPRRGSHHAVTLFGSVAAVRCTLICPRYLLPVMSPENQRSVYICDNTLIGWRVVSSSCPTHFFFLDTRKNDKK